jgi:hypothetical protein
MLLFLTIPGYLLWLGSEISPKGPYGEGLVFSCGTIKRWYNLEEMRPSGRKFHH